MVTWSFCRVVDFATVLHGQMLLSRLPRIPPRTPGAARGVALRDGRLLGQVFGLWRIASESQVPVRAKKLSILGISCLGLSTFLKHNHVSVEQWNITQNERIIIGDTPIFY